MRSIIAALALLLPCSAPFAQQTPTPVQGRPSTPPRPSAADELRPDDASAPTLGASLRAGYQIRASVQTVEANPLIFIQKETSARVCRAPLPREGSITPRYLADFSLYRCSEIK